MSSLVNLFLRELWRAWIKLQEVDHSKCERRANLIFPVFLSLGAVPGFGGAGTPSAPTQMLKQFTFPTSCQHSIWERREFSKRVTSAGFLLVLEGLYSLNSTGTQQRNTGYKRNIKQQSFGGLVLFIILWNICFISTVVTGWMLLWSTAAIPICVTLRAEGWWWCLSWWLCMLLLSGTDTSGKTSQSDWQIYPISCSQNCSESCCTVGMTVCLDLWGCLE